MKERKKQIYLQCLVLAVMMRCQYPIYADTVFPDTIYNTYEKPDYFRGAVSIEDVLEWNKEYLLGNEREETYYDFFSERSVPMIMTVPYDDYAPYAVMDEYRQYAYKISPFPPLSSSSAKKGIYLYSCITGNYISLVLSEEEVQGFIETEEKVKREIREKKAYVLQSLNEAEYGGSTCHASYGEEQVHIYLVNEERRKEMEEIGFVCDSGLYSLKEKYKIMKELWNQREYLGIAYIDTGETEIVICGTDAEEVFQEKMLCCGYDFKYTYIRGVWHAFGISTSSPFQEEDRLMALKYAETDFEEAEEFVTYLKDSKWIFTKSVSEKDWEALERAISVFKQEYPEYSCRNIYYHVAGDYNADVYLNFDNELLEFVDTLPDYEADKNVVTEYEYGDSQRLELKRMLRQYKEMFPEMSYAEIYKTYIKETEESTQISKEEKLYWYLWKKYSGEVKNTTSKAVRTEQFIEEGVESRENNKQSIYPAVIGFGILIAGCVVVFGIKMKRNQI